MTYEDILYDKQRSGVLITLNRPERMNALNDDLRREMHEAFDEAADDPDAHRAKLEAEMVDVRSPFRTAEAMDIEDLIDPRDTRPILCEWIELAYRQLEGTVGPKTRGMRP